MAGELLGQSNRPPSAEDGIPEEINNIALPVILCHDAADRRHQYHGGVDLLCRPLLGGVEVAPSVGPADHVAHAPLQFQSGRGAVLG